MPLAQSTHTVGDVALHVKRQFGDESGTQISNSDVIRWINQGQYEICRRSEVNKANATTPSVAAQAAYSFAGVNIVKLLAIFYNDIALENVSFEQVQETIGKYVEPTNYDYAYVPRIWYEWDDSIFIYPTPVANGDTIKIYAILAPATVANTSDTLSIPDTHYLALCNYVLQQAYQLDDNYNAAQIMGNQMDTAVHELSSTSSYQHYNSITVLPDDQ